MGQRVTFRERESNGAISDDGDPAAVSIVEPRVKFVKGWITGGTEYPDAVECGDGTDFPLEVTPAQLFEIMYRVKDAKVTAGSFITTFPNSPFDDIVNTMNFTSGDLPDDLFSMEDGDPIVSYVRGFCTSIESFDPPNDPDPMPTYRDAYFGGYYVNDNGLGTYVKIREASSELALWASLEDPATVFNNHGKFDLFLRDPGGYLFLDVSAMDFRFRTGFSFLAQEGYGTGVSGHPYGFSTAFFPGGGSTAYLNFSGKVAWVDDTGSGNPFDPGNRLFIGMIFAQANDPVVISTKIDNTLGTISPGVTTPTLTGTLFEVELSGGEVVSCPLYWYVMYTPGGESVSSAENYRVKATEWWQYALPNGAPNWDAGTGEWLA